MTSKLNVPSAVGLCLMIMAVTSLVAAPKNEHKQPPAPAAPAPAAHVRVVHETAKPDVHFSVTNVRVIREYYAPRYRQLPFARQPPPEYFSASAMPRAGGARIARMAMGSSQNWDRMARRETRHGFSG